ncbi:MAG: CapA family protein [Firmicutes bacterium]|nr:CapA family protein [Bacillota bacterium]
MLKFCATGDALIHIPIPANHPGTDHLAEYIKEADVRITNLETTITDYECFASSFSGGTPLTTSPDRLEDIKRYGFQAVGCANNHSMDFSFDGLLSTIRHLDNAGLLHAGTGRNLHEASSPAIIPTKEGTVAFLNQTAVYYGNDSGRAGNSHDGIVPRPGVNGLRHTEEYLVTKEQMDFLRQLADETMVNAEEELEQILGYSPADTDPEKFAFGREKFRLSDKTGRTSRCNETDMKRMERAIRNARMGNRYVVVSLHSHQFKARAEYEPDYYVEEYARRCIDAGADAFIGTGNHLMKGIEIYKGKPIFYCLGNFIFHSEYVARFSADVVENFGFPMDLTGLEVVARRKERATGSMESNDIYYKSIIPFWTFDGEELKEIKLLPIELGMKQPNGLRGFPSPASPETVLDHLKMVCEPYGTKVEADGQFVKIVL